MIYQSINQQHKAKSGQALVEFALVMIPLLFIMMGIIDFGRLLFAYSQASFGLRDALNHAEVLGSIGGTPKFLNCAGITKAATNNWFASDQDVEIYYFPAHDAANYNASLDGEPDYNDLDDYDITNGSGSHWNCETNPPASADLYNSDLLFIHIEVTVNPIFLPFDPFTMDFSGERTIVKQIIFGAGPGDADQDGLDDDWELAWLNGCPADMTIPNYPVGNPDAGGDMLGSMTDLPVNFPYVRTTYCTADFITSLNKWEKFLYGEEVFNDRLWRATDDLDGDGCNNGCEEDAGTNPWDKNDRPSMIGDDPDDDGIVTADDDCPDLAGVSANDGCPPDADNDDVFDSKEWRDGTDTCEGIGTANQVTFDGCPDTDLDGWAEPPTPATYPKQDACIGESSPISNGCFVNEDADEVPDHLDACLGLYGHATAAGCPDYDGDTVRDDTADLCTAGAPGSVGSAEDDGCPDADTDNFHEGDTDLNPPAEDLCPGNPGDFQGCDDDDSDGFINPNDNCPLVPGSNTSPGYVGCPQGTVAVKLLRGNLADCTNTDGAKNEDVILTDGVTPTAGQTANDGSYTFTQVPAGTYYVQAPTTVGNGGNLRTLRSYRIIITGPTSSDTGCLTFTSYQAFTIPNSGDYIVTVEYHYAP